MCRVRLVIPANVLQGSQRLDPALDAVRIEIEDSEGFLGKGRMLENVVGPQPTLIFIRHFLDENPAEILNWRCMGGLPPIIAMIPG